MDASTHHTGDFVSYPMNRVVGTIADASQARAAIEALLLAGLEHEAIDVLHGDEGAHRLDPAGLEHGFLEQFQRTLIRLAGPAEEYVRLRHHAEDVRAGRFVIMVLAKDQDRRDLVERILDGHGAEFIGFYGPLAMTSYIPKRRPIMKLVIIGGTGLIGSKLVTKLKEHGHEALPASPDTGVNTITGEGLADALQGASVVVDVSNSPSFEESAVMEFFTTSTRNLLKYAAAAGVKHYVALSVVGTERIPDSPYLRAKAAQETLIKAGGIPYSIIHATQFFEFVKRIADEATDGTTVRLPAVLIQPMAADDVATAVGRIAEGAPVNGTVEVAGPEQFRFDELIRHGLNARNDPREVVVDPHARYFGAELSERSLIPAGDARLGEMRFQEWLGQPMLQPR